MEVKIDALNRLNRHEGDVQLTSKEAGIPERTLREWRRDEKELRRVYRQRQKQRLGWLKFDLSVKMLEQGQDILARMDGETLDKAPLSQLASALSALVSHALKLEEAIDELDQDEEQVIRLEYYYDDAVQSAPPWTGASEGRPRAVQSGRLRETLGQDGVGQIDAAGERHTAADARVVDGADASDGGPGLARLKGEHQEGEGYYD